MSYQKRLEITGFFHRAEGRYRHSRLHAKISVLMEITDYRTVTELPQSRVSPEQVKRLCDRYRWAGSYCRGKDVVEVACGSGQGLGLLNSISHSFVAGDISPELLEEARNHGRDHIDLLHFDAESLPFQDSSKDAILLLEALYYLPHAEKFVQECRRVLRPGGVVLIATANKDLFDFNPSPFSHRYYGVLELKELFQGFELQCFGNTPLTSVSVRQRVLRPLKKLAVELRLIPQTAKGKELLKRVVFGKLVSMPSEIEDEETSLDISTPLPLDQPDQRHKVIFCVARWIPTTPADLPSAERGDSHRT